MEWTGHSGITGMSRIPGFVPGFVIEKQHLAC